MGTISDKLTYLNETKSQLKDMINYGLPSEQQITSSTTFRNYVSSIFNAFLEALRTPDTLFTNLPKKSGTGAVISLNDTANAPMRIELGATELTQAGTPTPSSPQAVHTISGSNKVVVNGKNLAYTNWAEDFVSRINDNTKATLTTQDGRKCLWFTAGAGYGEYDSKYIFKTNWKANTQYTISYYGYGEPGYLNACIYYTDGTFTGISGTPITSWSKVVLTSTAGKTIKDFRGYWAGGNSYIDIDTFMVEEGSTATTYEPYVSQEADIDLGYENLANITSFSAGNRTEVYNNTCYFKNGTYSTASSVALYLNNQTDLILKANQTYTISVICNGKITASTYKVIYLKIGDQSTINMGSLGSNTRINYQYTPTADEPIKFISFDMGTNQTFEDYSVNIQVEKGSVAHPYTEYGKKIEYCKIGNYEDKFIRTSGKNLFDVSNYQNLSTTYEYNLNNYHIKKIQLEPNTDYTISHNSSSSSSVVILMNNVQQVNSSGYYDLRNASGSKTFTTDSTGCLYIGVLYTASDTDYNNRINSCYLVINEGTTALPYEPYGSNEWYIKKNIGKVVLDGSETWVGTGSVFQTATAITPNKGDVSLNAYSNYFIHHYYPSSILSYIQNGEFGWNSNKQLTIRNDNIIGQADFKTWLETNNVIVVYPLANSEYLPITGTLANQLENIYQKLLSYTGTTNISQVNNDLSFNLSVSAIEEL